MVKEGDIFFFHRPKEDVEEVTLNEWSESINRLLVQVLDSEDADDFSRQI
jgi:hypothetical protein